MYFLSLRLLLQVSAKTVGRVEHLNFEIQMQPTWPETPALGWLPGGTLKNKTRGACSYLPSLRSVTILPGLWEPAAVLCCYNVTILPELRNSPLHL